VSNLRDRILTVDRDFTKRLLIDEIENKVHEALGLLKSNNVSQVAEIDDAVSVLEKLSKDLY